MSTGESTGRFMRPIQVGTTHRSRRRVQTRRVLVIAVNLLLAAGVVAGSVWVYQRTQQDERFAIRTIETAGAVHAPSNRIAAILDRYDGANLFRLDIGVLEAQLVAVPWIERVSIEKKLPDTLRLEFSERVPAAVVRTASGDQFIDANGVIFARFDPAATGKELPIIADATDELAAGCVSFLERLRENSPDLYVRIAEIRPAPSSGWIIRDSLLEAPVFVSEGSANQKWRTLTEIAATEGFGEAGIEYADLRFEKQIVVKKLNYGETQGEVEHAEN